MRMDSRNVHTMASLAVEGPWHLCAWTAEMPSSPPASSLDLGDEVTAAQRDRTAFFCRLLLNNFHLEEASVGSDVVEVTRLQQGSCSRRMATDLRHRWVRRLPRHRAQSEDSATRNAAKPGEVMLKLGLHLRNVPPRAPLPEGSRVDACEARQGSDRGIAVGLRLEGDRCSAQPLPSVFLQLVANFRDDASSKKPLHLRFAGSHWDLRDEDLLRKSLQLQRGGGFGVNRCLVERKLQRPIRILARIVRCIR
mmetsp:Transcript_70204/g.182103  ORF Transcript_70204/g.182103 Transcript_70204/m.182103 type:complete len:251 (-) Transcript_70204:2535-3287(-)